MIKKSFSLFISFVMIMLSVFSVISFAEDRLLGDVNNDGKVNTKDARLLLRVTALLDSIDDDETKIAADCNLDGKINTKDARKILRVVAKLEFMPDNPEGGKEQEEPVDDGKLTFEKLPDDIKAFINGKFYCKGSMLADGTYSEMTMAISGDSIAMSMDLDGIDIMFIKYDTGKKKLLGKGNKMEYYFVNPNENTYSEITTAEMSLIGLSEDDMNITFAVIDKNNIQIETAEVNNGAYTDYVISGNDSINHFYMRNGELVKLMCCDANDQCQSVMTFDEFTGDVPASAFSVSGYEKVRLVKLFTDMMDI